MSVQFLLWFAFSDIDRHKMETQINAASVLCSIIGSRVDCVCLFVIRSGKMKVPDWTDLVKLGQHKEMAPYDDDWYYTRAGTVH